MDEKRLDKVDVDNLAKAILDCFKGLVFEDDSQIVNLIVSKEINGYTPINGLMVGIRRLENKQSWIEGMKLAYLEKKVRVKVTINDLIPKMNTTIYHREGK